MAIAAAPRKLKPAPKPMDRPAFVPQDPAFAGTEELYQAPRTIEFKDVLEDAPLLERYVKFARENYVAEEVNFYLDVKIYSQAGPAELMAQGLRIFNMYIKEKSEFEININNKMRKRVIAMFEGENPELTGNEFDEALGEVLILMRTNSFARFKLSPDLLGPK
jgi:hypothetical protein